MITAREWQENQFEFAWRLGMPENELSELSYLLLPTISKILYQIRFSRRKTWRNILVGLTQFTQARGK